MSENENCIYKFDFKLDDFQEEALFHINNGKSVVVCAPTGAGKTCIAQMAIHKALAENTRIFSQIHYFFERARSIGSWRRNCRAMMRQIFFFSIISWTCWKVAHWAPSVSPGSSTILDKGVSRCRQ